MKDFWTYFFWKSIFFLLSEKLKQAEKSPMDFLAFIQMFLMVLSYFNKHGNIFECH